MRESRETQFLKQRRERHLLEQTEVFIVRIWFEPREIRDGQVIWRGIIEHLPSGNKKYLAKLEEVTAFIKPFLEGRGKNMEE